MNRNYSMCECTKTQSKQSIFLWIISALVVTDSLCEQEYNFKLIALSVLEVIFQGNV